MAVLDLAGLFLLLAGFVIGLGAVTVIDLHGFLGRRSSYWTEATIRTHHVTKPLIWLGTSLAILGGSLLYRHEPFAGAVRYHAYAAVALISNGCFLSFVVSPALTKRENEGRSRELLPFSLQWKIAVSFVISFFGWWSSLAVLTAYLLARR